MNYVLSSAEQSNRDHPATFAIPSRARRVALKVGEHAKLVFLTGTTDGPSAERMWVEVTKRERGGYVGKLANKPFVIGELRLGDEVRFGPEHVAATED